MEQIIKIVKAFFIKEDGEVDKSAVSGFKEALLWMLLGAAVLFGCLYYMSDDEEEYDEGTEVEHVEVDDKEAWI